AGSGSAGSRGDAGRLPCGHLERAEWRRARDEIAGARRRHARTRHGCCVSNGWLSGYWRRAGATTEINARSSKKSVSLAFLLSATWSRRGTSTTGGTTLPKWREFENSAKDLVGPDGR